MRKSDEEIVKAKPAELQDKRQVQHEDHSHVVIAKPGGAILSAIAQVEGFDPGDIQQVTFDTTTNRLKFATANGIVHSFEIDPEDLAVAVRVIYDKNLDPVLSMGFDPWRGCILKTSRR
jgi:hypothetical protein